MLGIFKDKKQELGDDVQLVHSPIDGKLICVCMLHGHEVCQYCFKQFGSSIEVFPLDKLGNAVGEVRIKVHPKCHDEYKSSGRYAKDGIEPRSEPALVPPAVATGENSSDT